MAPRKAQCSLQVIFTQSHRGYSLPIGAPQTAADHQQEWGVMLAHGDLQSASLELLPADKTVLFELKIRFEGQKPEAGLIDFANGVELPVLDRACRDRPSPHHPAEWQGGRLLTPAEDDLEPG